MNVRVLFLPLFFLISISLFFICCTGPRSGLDCSDYKTGRFQIHSKGTDTFMVERNDSLQYEWNSARGVEKLYRIRWISDCEYELVNRNPPVNAAAGSKEAMLDSIMQIPSRVTITAATSSYCIFEVRKKGVSMVYADTMWLMK